MKRYIGVRTAEGCVVRVERGGCHWPLNPRFDLWHHSPTGFEWGYGGSGPAQLALALIADACEGDDIAVSYHQRYKGRIVMFLPQDRWILYAGDIVEMVGAWILADFAARQAPAMERWDWGDDHDS